MTGTVRQWIAKCLLLGVSLLFAVAIGELGVRLLRPQDVGIWRTDPEGLITLRPEIDVFLPSFGQNVRTNSLGFRDDPRAADRAPGVFRIVLLGDSFMEALQVSAADSFPRLLAAELSSSSGRSVEVVNAAVSGWGTDEQLTWFRRTGGSLRPDLVLVAMTLHNDVHDNLGFRHHEFDGARMRARPREPLPAARFAELELKARCAFHSHLCRFLSQTLAARRVPGAAKALDTHVMSMFEAPDDRIEFGWWVTRQHLEALKRESEALGARFAVFLIPLMMQLTEEGFAEFVRGHGVEPEDTDPVAPQKRMAEWGRQSGTLVSDLLPAFQAHKREDPGILYLPDDGHWNEEGHALAAGAVARDLIRQGRFASPPSDSSPTSETAGGTHRRPAPQ